MFETSGVIFDMDGVIFDTECLWKNAFEAANQKYGLNLTEKYRQSTCGKSEQLIREELSLMNPGLDVSGYREYMLNEVKKNISDGSFDIKKGFPELISFLKNSGYKIALATSSHKDRAEMLFSLKNLKMHDIFDAMVFAEDIGSHSKPDPLIFLTAAQRIGHKPQSCCVLEDSINGIEAAVKGNFMPIMVIDLIQPDDFCRENSRIANDLTEVESFLRSSK